MDDSGLHDIEGEAPVDRQAQVLRERRNIAERRPEITVPQCAGHQ
jgi:hypothetical protein